MKNLFETKTLFKISDIPIRFHSTLWLMFGYLLYLSKGVNIIIPYKNENYGINLLFNMTAFLVSYISVLLHELGHCSQARNYGARIHEILLTPIGGIANVDFSYIFEPKRIISVVWAGLKVSALLSGSVALIELCLVVSGITVTTYIDRLLWFFIYLNALIFGFNLLPIYPLDGGRIARELYKLIFRNSWKAKKFSCYSSVVILLSLMFVGIFSKSVILIAICVFLGFNVGGELLHMKKMERRAAYVK